MRNMITVRAIMFLLLSSTYGCTNASSEWPMWQDFKDRFVQADGRVIDVTFEQKSTSEGQSYGLFFALVANQRHDFDTILKWTSDNLAGGQLGDTLPGWLWGKHSDGSWSIKDQNPASDADLWIAYCLLEAERLWHEPRYGDIAQKLLRQIERHETVDSGGTGALLLPGRYGFKLANGRVRIVTSYLPGFMFQYLAAADPQGPWQVIWDNYIQMTPTIFSAGIAPDRFVVDASGTVIPDTEQTPSASYDAIRVYLWAGMSGRNSADMLKLLSRYAVVVRELGQPPENVDPLTGNVLKADYSPLGFSGALLPYLAALGDTPTLETQRNRLSAANYKSPNYYDQVLIMFGKGWMDGHYRFDDRGRLQTRWMTDSAKL